MKGFKSYITEASGKNLHMVHLEDSVIDGGVTGTRNVFDYLRALRDMLAGNAAAPVSVTVKWDGCLHEDTVILTDQGEFTIKDIVENSDKYGITRVMGRKLDEQLQYDLLVPMIGHSSEGTKDWVEVTLENGSSIKLTADHEVHTTNRGWVKAIELTENDDITEL